MSESDLHICLNLPRADFRLDVDLLLPGSGITVHGSAVTRFRYSVTNTVRDGTWAEGTWQADTLPPGDYLLRVSARDHSGNEAQGRRDLKLRHLRLRVANRILRCLQARPPRCRVVRARAPKTWRRP